MANENSKMNQALETAIEDHLNEAQLGVFRREMDRLQSVEAEYTALREEHKIKINHCNNLVKELAALKDQIENLDAREERLRIREKEMAEQKTELHIENQLIDLRRTNAEQRVEDHKNMVGLVFRSPAFKQSVSEYGTRDVMTPVPMSDSGAYGNVQRDTLDENKTTVTEITEE